MFNYFLRHQLSIIKYALQGKYENIMASKSYKDSRNVKLYIYIKKFLNVNNLDLAPIYISRSATKAQCYLRDKYNTGQQKNKKFLRMGFTKNCLIS